VTAVYRELTVARIRTPDDADHVEVLFLESARIYELRSDRPDFAELIGLLRRAELDGRPIKVGFASIDGDAIEDVQIR
jgi:hypothetical protein